MAFSFSSAVSGGGGFGGSPAPSGGVQVQDGPELEEITTDELGFAPVNGEVKLRLLPKPWDPLPPPSSSLLAVNSSKGLLAAAGPDALYLFKTDVLREILREEGVKVRDAKPFLTIPQPGLGHVAFSSGETVMVISSQNGGGIVAFQVDNLIQGQTDPALQITTNGVGLRALIPNPAPESEHLVAVITNQGDLLLADLKEARLQQGSDGPVLIKNASCLSWSTRGKQLVVGLATGTATQVKPDGSVVAEIPKSTSIPDGMHISAISWLENDSFFIIYTSNDTSNGIPPSEYYMVNREPKTSNYTFHKLPEVVAGFGMERLPSHHYISRLRDFPPHIQDMLVLSATTGSDISLLTKTDKPLSEGSQITGSFTLTIINEDARRAQLPIGSDQTDTSPIGMAIDLSSKEKVPNPIPSLVDLFETPQPCPNLVVLNNEGILVSSWIIYSDSVKENTIFSGFGAVNTTQQDGMQVSEPAAPKTSMAPPPAPSQSTFGQPTFGAPAPFTKPATPTFGAPGMLSQNPLGGGSTPTFGSSSTIGTSKPAWTSTGFGGNAGTNGNATGFGTPAFGSSSAVASPSAPAFGAPAALGSRTPAFGQATAAPSFGQAGFGAKSENAFSPSAPSFGGGNSSEKSGFSQFASAGGFGAKNDSISGNPFANLSKQESPFTKATGTNVFGQPQTQSLFGAKSDGGSVFGQSNNKPAPFGATKTSGLKLESSFQGDGTAKDDLPKPAQPGGFGFGNSLGDILNETKAVSPTTDREADMEDEVGESADEEIDRPEPRQPLITPPSTLQQPKATPAPPVSNLFGSGLQSTTPQTEPSSKGWSFGGIPSTTPKETPNASQPIFGTKSQTDETPAAVSKSEPVKLFSDIQTPLFGRKEEIPKIKEEPPSDDEASDLKNIPEAPLPPDPSSKPTYILPSDSSNSSGGSKKSAGDAPLPPDFLHSNKAAIQEAEKEQLPEDTNEEEFSSDFEGSGEDVTQDISPIEEPADESTEQLPAPESPESSYKSDEKSLGDSPTGGVFTKPAAKAPLGKGRLFGEIGSAPVLPPPKPQESPRSPSPVRNLLPPELRSTARSVSAPAHRPSAIDARKSEYSQSPLGKQITQAQDVEAQQEQARRAALAKAKAEAEARELESLEDDENEQIRKELDMPVQPSENLGHFITYQPASTVEATKSGIPAQIECLYHDINSMICTLGINARSMSSFLLHETSQQAKSEWPKVLQSESPMDAMSQDWFLGDISRLHEGRDVLTTSLQQSKIDDVAGKLQQCQQLLSTDILDLRTKLASIKRTLSTKSGSESNADAPLSAEQSSVQHDLRIASGSVQTKLVQLEDELGMLRAKIAENESEDANGKRRSVIGRTASQKKPTVAAVSNTVLKLTAMAEKRSADIDVLEAQLRKLDASLGSTSTTPQQPFSPRSSTRAHDVSTPGSGANSTYHTPTSRFGGSVRSTPGSSRRSQGASANEAMAAVSNEDKQRWRANARRKKEVAAMMQQVLEERNVRIEGK